MKDFRHFVAVDKRLPADDVLIGAVARGEAKVWRKVDEFRAIVTLSDEDLTLITAAAPLAAQNLEKAP